LEARSGAPDFWSDAQSAQAVMRELDALKTDVSGWLNLSRRAHDALELLELAQADPGLADGVADEAAALKREFEASEFRLLLSGPHDRGDAIMAIHAGAGGIDAADWASMLLRMYLRWAENRGLKTEILDQLEGEEAGIRNVTISVAGECAYGYLRAERGVHRLVRLSPFDSAHRRHTSFALVEVWPDLPDNSVVTINPNDIKIDTFRASSAGGQHVQKNATAVRLTHLPTGIVVSCQNERSQAQNRETAMKILRAKLYEIEEEKQRKALAELKGDHVKAEWGSQIRSYVLHPYQMVKDHRTDYEVGNAQAVLDGRLDDFMESYLRSAVGARNGIR
jgi:peptide chain release factor 2